MTAGPGAAVSARGAEFRGHAAMLAFALGVSGSFSLGGLAAPHMDPAALNAVRFALGSLAIAPLALGPGGGRSGRRGPAIPGGLWRYGLLGALFAVYFVLMFEALRRTDPVSTGAVFTLTPAMSALFGWVLLRQVTTPRMALALAVAGAGAVWVIFRGDLAAIAAFRIGEGEALFLAGCAAHALFTPLLRLLNRGEATGPFTLGVLVAATLILAVWGGPALVATDWAALPPAVWAAILYLALVTTAGTSSLLQYAAMRLPSAKVMAYTYLVPSFILVWEAVLGHGLPGAHLLPGIAATIAALLILLLRD